MRSRLLTTRPLSRLFTYTLGVGLAFATLRAELSAQPEPPPTKPQLDYSGGTGAIKGGPSFERPMMWSVRCPELAEFHLVGTMHIPDARFAQLSPTLLRLIDEADAVYGELDLSDKVALTAKLTPHMLLPSGETLESKLPVDVYASLKSYLELKGSSASMFGMMKPEAVEILLPMLELMPLLAQGLPSLDEVILTRAKEAGKEVGGVETVEEQIESLFSKSEEESVESLKHTLKRLMELHQRGEAPHLKLMTAFFKGDEGELLAEIMAELEGAPPAQLKLFDRLLKQRNKRMARRVIKLVRRAKKRAHLFAFGAAHFIGKDSINALFKGQGCSSQRLK